MKSDLNINNIKRSQKQAQACAAFFGRVLNRLNEFKHGQKENNTLIC